MDLGRHRRVERALWDSFGVRPAEAVVEVGPGRIRHRVQVVGDGPPLLFVHGASVTGTCFAPLAARLPDHRCLLLDRAGCGFSDRTPTRLDLDGFEAFADRYLLDVLDALDLEHAAVVSTSFGGYFALRAAAADPDRFTSICHLAWTAGAPIDRVPLVMRVASARGIGRFMTRLPVPRSTARAMLHQIGLRDALAKGKVSDAFIDWFHSVLRDTDTVRNEIDALPPLVSVRHGLNRDLLLDPALLASVKVRASFLWGTEDPMGGAEVAEAFVAQLPDATLELVPGAGHAPWVDEPDRTADFVRRSRASGPNDSTSC